MHSISVVVSGLAGPVAQVTLKSDARVRDLKRAIKDKSNIPSKRQRLLYRDADLHDYFHLGALDGNRSERVASNSTLHMSLIQRTEQQVAIISKIALCGCDEVLDYLQSIAEDPEEFLDDVDIMRAAIQKNADAMQYASDRLRRDRCFVLSQVALCGYWLEHADVSLLSDKDFVIAAVGTNGYALKGVGNFRSDRDVVQAALKNDGRALEYASPELQADIGIVRFAVEKDGQALQYANAEFRTSKELVLMAVRRDGRALRFADESLRADREVVFTALDDSPMAVKWVAEPLRNNGEIQELLAAEQKRHERWLKRMRELYASRDDDTDSD